ncbi:MAG: hypothetical protein V1861_02405 [Candidatus Micrarchaeota archaeon]
MEYKYALLFALLLVPFASAIEGLDVEREAALNAAMDNVECKTDFMVGVIDSMVENIEGVDYLNDHVDVLNTDEAQLQEYADEGDGQSFKDYVRDSYAPHMREAKDDIHDARLEANITPEIKAELRDDYNSLGADYEACNLDSLERFAEAKLNGYEEVLELAEDKVANLSGKGVDTSSLTALIEDAREEIVDPLSEALENADNSTEVHDAIAQYCLFNGCPNGTNFHFAAKFEAEKLESILEFIADDAEAAGLGDDVDSAQEDIDAAQAVIDEAGTSQYTEEQGEDLKDYLLSAADTIMEIISTLRAS